MLIPLLHRAVRKSFLSRGISSNRAALGGGSLHYYEASPPDPLGCIALVHGLGTSASTWTHVLPVLCRTYHVIAPDLPGFGFSTPLPQPSVRPIETYVGVLEEFLERTLGERSFTLLGHSLGGWLTMRYALKNPRRVEHLILVNTAGIYYQGAEQLVALFDLRSTKDTNRLLDRLWMHYPWYFRLFTPFIFEDMVKRKVPEIVRGIRETDIVDTELSRLYMPVSIIWGRGDGLLPIDTVKTLSDRLPARTIHFIEKCGHVPQLEASSAFLEVLRKVLSERLME